MTPSHPAVERAGPRAGPAAPPPLPLPISLPDAVDPVTVLHWPSEAAERAALVEHQVPHLLVLDDGAAPPLVWDDREDWIRATAGPAEVTARARRLLDRAPPPSPPLPVLDGDGVLRAGDGREVHLPTVEARLLHALMERRDRVVRRDRLRRAGWPAGGVSDRAVDGRITRLRRRIAPCGLSIATVRGVGYLLERSPSP